MGHHDTTGAWTAHLSPREAAAAGRAVFTWSLIPAAARLAREAAAGHDCHDAVTDLRDAVRLLDALGWPDEAHTPTDLGPEESGTVRDAARIQLGHGLDPDPVARARVARGRADAPSAHGGTLRVLLRRLGEDPPDADGDT
ncbi:hypothetical protein [Miltoncostaea oceani]|uniref:hypothetical protein n=1 Tax=Miltoncostaea oceani TaxID=2843216 RepID=UPI001C3DF960|nr:hypothetical protein [Miltoncostaea oceani]